MAARYARQEHIRIVNDVYYQIYVRPIEIAAATVPAFKANKALKDAVNK